MRTATYAALLLLLVGSFLAGTWYHRQTSSALPPGATRKILYYVDPMHPAYKSDKPGIAPDCGMELVPVYADEGMSSVGSAAAMQPGTVRVSSEKRQMIGVQVGVVAKTTPIRTIRTVGRVVVDENRVHRIVTGSEGYLNKLNGGTTGTLVQKDQILSTYFSREIANSLPGFFVALNARGPSGAVGVPGDQTGTAGQQIPASEANLLALGVSETQLAELKRTRQFTREIEIRAPVTGLVVSRNVAPGLRFDRNTELYRIADLGRVWIVADLFENEARFFSPGITARLTLPAAGKVFHARVTDILPLADSSLRTLKIRLELDNPEYLLRPDMVVDVELPITLPPSIVVPAEAVLDSGITRRVFVERGEGSFEPRAVETGWRSGDSVEILTGVKPGERIAISGTFLIDSESRMKAAAAGPTGPMHEGHAHPAVAAADKAATPAARAFAGKVKSSSTPSGLQETNRAASGTDPHAGHAPGASSIPSRAPIPGDRPPATGTQAPSAPMLMPQPQAGPTAPMPMPGAQPQPPAGQMPLMPAPRLTPEQPTASQQPVTTVPMQPTTPAIIQGPRVRQPRPAPSEGQAETLPTPESPAPSPENGPTLK
jgi:membrane fusion protein, copper/silver efflux system